MMLAEVLAGVLEHNATMHVRQALTRLETERTHGSKTRCLSVMLNTSHLTSPRIWRRQDVSPALCKTLQGG